MRDQTVELKAREYVYNLGNSAKENGFKPDEGWQLNVATAEEKSALEKKYFPTLSLAVMPEGMSELLKLIRLKLAPITYVPAKAPDNSSFDSGSLQYLVAFNPDRQRR
jgi:hypothetical protein